MNRRTLTILGALVVTIAAVFAVVVVAGGSSSPTSTSSSVTVATTAAPTTPGAATETAGGIVGSALSSAPSPATEVADVVVNGETLPTMPADAVSDPAYGKLAPALSGVSFDGSKTSFTPGTRATLVVFFAHWCSHCNNELPRLRAWFDEGRTPEGLDVFGVSTVAAEDRPNYPASKWATNTMSWPWPVMVDSSDYDALMSYGATSFPTMVLVGADGKVISRISGEVGTEKFDTWVREGLSR